MVTYDRNRLLHQKHTIKFDNTKQIEMAEKAGFPNCKGLFPDCPENPDKNDPMCKNCPVLEKAESSKY